MKKNKFWSLPWAKEVVLVAALLSPVDAIADQITNALTGAVTWALVWQVFWPNKGSRAKNAGIWALAGWALGYYMSEQENNQTGQPVMYNNNPQPQGYAPWRPQYAPIRDEIIVVPPPPPQEQIIHVKPPKEIKYKFIVHEAPKEPKEELPSTNLSNLMIVGSKQQPTIPKKIAPPPTKQEETDIPK